MGRLFYLSYLFLLRVPSEGLPILRDALSGNISDKSPQAVNAFMAVRAVGDSTRLILKLKKRKLNKTGSVMLRPCFCSGGTFVPAGLCPTHDFWPAAQAAVLPGDQLFPNLQGGGSEPNTQGGFESYGS